jgi:hypothetical protein
MKSVAVGALVLALALPACAQAAAMEAKSGQGDVALTIYNNDLALIQDQRRLDLPAGKSRQELPDVSAQIRPETVTLSARGAAVVEQNFDFDLLTPGKLLDKSVGQAVTVVRTNPATGAETAETAQVLANNQGTLLQIGGRIEVLNDLGARIVFPSLPADLRSRPTLSVTLDADKSGPRPVTLSYLSRGFGWKADYVTLFDEEAGKIDVQGWITLRNDSGTSFGDARVLLVAGSVGSDDNRQSYRPSRPRGAAAGVEASNRERLGDFYVYPIQGRTTVANAQQKQVSFLDVKGAPAGKAYVYRAQWLENHDQPESVDTVLRFSTSRSGGLGDALPAGVMRVYMRDARGLPQFIGEKGVDHTAMGAPVAIATGEAFDVKVQPTIVKRERITSDEWEQTARWRVTRNKQVDVVGIERAVVYWRTSMNYKVTNARPHPVVVEVVQAGLDNRWSDTRVPSESLHGEQRTLDERIWRVTVPANGATVLSAQFDTRY